MEIRRDYFKAVEYILKAVELGNPIALGNLYNLYHSVERYETDNSIVINHCLKAAELGNA